MPQPQLPTELLRAIIAELASSEGGTPADLAACCLVSKSMLPFAQEALYRDRLSATLFSNPRIGAAVKKLAIVQDSDAVTQATRQPVEALVGACERLEQFVWHSAYGYNVEGAGWLESLLKRRGSTLQLLDMLGYYPWSTIPFVDMLSHLPQLRYLTLNHLPGLASTPAPHPSFRLTKISVRDSIQHALLDFLLGASQESLTELDFAGFITDDTYDFAAYKSLHTISISNSLGVKTPTDLARLFQAFGTVPSLETLDTRCYITTLDLEAIDVLRLLPPSLRHIHDMSGLALSTRYLLAFFGDPTCLPKLSHIGVSSSVLIGGRYTERTEAEMEALEAAATARGVKLGWGWM